jgi:mandelamide amidase
MPALSELNASVSFPVVLFEFVRDMRKYLEARGRGVTLEEMIAAVGSPDVRGAVGTLLTGGGIPEDVYESALQARAKMQALYAQTFESHRIEALVFPTTPRVAALVGEDETVDLNGTQQPTFGAFIRNTDPGSNASLPGATIPLGLANNLPVGLALDGPIDSDRRLLAIAEAVQSALPPAPQLETPN